MDEDARLSSEFSRRVSARIWDPVALALSTPGSWCSSFQAVPEAVSSVSAAHSRDKKLQLSENHW